MNYILGINAFHGDSSACLLRSGQLIAAAEEERFRRLKHWAGFPLEAINYCLAEEKISIQDIAHIAINTDPSANFLKKIIYTLKNSPDFKMILNRIKNTNAKFSIKNEIEKNFGTKIKSKIHYVEHHLAHLASSHLVSPFQNSIAISVDGFGDFSSCACGVGHGNKIEIKHRIFFPHSLGIFYQALTQFIGFPNYGDEYKVMGLAPYGKPNFMKQMHQVLHIKNGGLYSLNLDFFIHHKKNFSYQWENGLPVIGRLFDKSLERLFGIRSRKKNEPLQQIHYDIAHSTQAIYEEAFFNLLNMMHSKYNIDNLTLAGGCAMNSVANGKVYEKTAYKKIYIQSAPGDAGGALGSAYVVAAKLGFLKKKFEMSHAYWGPFFCNDYHKILLDKNQHKIKKHNCITEYIEDERQLCITTSKSIDKGQVVGWFQGRMEWGPRALGNRSILGDPRRRDMKDILNLKIKKRESFRPFAPSILREKVQEWFEQNDNVPFMSQVFKVKKEKRAQIPAVTHIDNTGRLQTVSTKMNPRYHRLISEFEKISGVPIVLNTSFNENEPIVCRPEEALETFFRTKMDILVLGNWIIKRKYIN
ncbi:COG2192 Predicted carbamoyl transferase, NodU family [Candidatus Pelagibacterales bacterium]